MPGKQEKIPHLKVHAQTASLEAGSAGLGNEAPGQLQETENPEGTDDMDGQQGLPAGGG
jgi:hypothetical protein